MPESECAARDVLALGRGFGVLDRRSKGTIPVSLACSVCLLFHPR